VVHIVVVSILMAACTTDGQSTGAPAPASPLETTVVTFPDSSQTANLVVDVADDEAERARGLMGVTSLPPDRGMVFLFDAPSTGRFWMKNTLIPLSIAFWDARGRVVGLADMRPCHRDACPTYGAPDPYVGAVEANLGWFDAHDVNIGDRVHMKACCAS